MRNREQIKAIIEDELSKSNYYLLLEDRLKRAEDTILFLMKQHYNEPDQEQQPEQEVE